MKTISLPIRFAVSVSACLGDWLKLDDFQSANAAKLPTEDGWTVDRHTTAVVESLPGQSANQALRTEHGDGDVKRHDIVCHRGALRVPPGKTANVFLRFF